MPFTPFHMGAALVVKPGLNKRFSVITFGIAQVAMDIEPGIGLLRGAEVLHGASHTIVGALIIAFLVMLVAPGICNFLLGRWNKEVMHYKLPWLVEADPVSKIAVIIGASVGSLSHVLLDSLMHHDIQPLLPFSPANPLMGLMTHDGVYQLCVIAGVLGTVAWIARKWMSRARRVSVEPVVQEPVMVGANQGFWVRWVSELRATWLWVFLLCLLPSLLWGSAFFAMWLLIGVVLIGVPVTALTQWRKRSKRGWRQLAVMLSVSFATVALVFQLDKQIPNRATPIATAIETFRTETGQYPGSVEILVPKYLAEVPVLRFCVIQPQVWYGVRGGKPALKIPSARGDQFASYEYDFEAKAWMHHL